MDNKISLFILGEFIKQISQENCSLQIVGVATAQEELGCRGSVVATNKIDPNIAFCLDMGLATDTPKMSKQKYGTFKLGKGVGIIRSADNNEKLTKMLEEVANENGIAYQLGTGYLPTGGTEAARIQLSLKGIPTANISVPNRYMHSIVEMCDLDDVSNAILLLKKEIQCLQAQEKINFNLYE